MCLPALSMNGMLLHVVGFGHACIYLCVQMCKVLCNRYNYTLCVYMYYLRNMCAVYHSLIISRSPKYM